MVEQRRAIVVDAHNCQLASIRRARVCGDVEPAAGCAIAWILLRMSAVAHAMHYCGGHEGDSDDEGPNTMYLHTPTTVCPEHYEQYAQSFVA